MNNTLHVVEPLTLADVQKFYSKKWIIYDDLIDLNEYVEQVPFEESEDESFEKPLNPRVQKFYAKKWVPRISSIGKPVFCSERGEYLFPVKVDNDPNSEENIRHMVNKYPREVVEGYNNILYRGNDGSLVLCWQW